MNRIKELNNLIAKCDCVYDVGSDHALLAINLLKNKKAKQVVNIEKNWQPHNAGKANLAKNHLTTRTINVLNDGLKDITKKIFVQPNYVVIAGMGGRNIVDILENRDEKLSTKAIYLLEPNCDADILRKYLAKNKWETILEDVCLDRTKFYQIIVAKQSTKAKKITNFEAHFGQLSKQKDKASWIKYLKFVIKKIETKKLQKFSKEYNALYKELKLKVKK